MRHGYLMVLALLVPVLANAQTAKPAPGQTSLEIVATGEIDAPASSITAPLTFTVTAATQEAADKAKQSKFAAILGALQQEGIPSSALTPLDENDPARISAAIVVPTLDDATIYTDEKSDEKKEESASASDGYSLKVATIAQLKAVSDALRPLDVHLGAPASALDDAMPVERQAKAKALGIARGDADAYARELGLRVVRVSRISEAGNGLLMPGLQDMFQHMAGAGPMAMRRMFESRPGMVKISETIVVEFVLAP